MLFKIRLAISNWLWWLSDKIDPVEHITEKMIRDAMDNNVFEIDQKMIDDLVEAQTRYTRKP